MDIIVLVLVVLLLMVLALVLVSVAHRRTVRGGGNAEPETLPKLAPETLQKLREVWEAAAGEKNEVAGRILPTGEVAVDAKGYYDGMPQDLMRVDLPGMQFHTHPRISGPGCETLTPPSASDIFVIMERSLPEAVVTQRGVWLVSPRAKLDFYGVVAMMRYVHMLNARLEMPNCRQGILAKKEDENVQDLARAYARLLSEPDGRVLNGRCDICDIEDSELLEAVRGLYSMASENDILDAHHHGPLQFVGRTPVLVEWVPWPS